MKFKQFIKKLIRKGIDFLKWVWNECKDWQTLLLLFCVMGVISMPIWLGYILYFLFKFKWAMWVATAMWAFWLGPFSPFMVLCISITLSIKRWGRTWLRKGVETRDKIAVKFKVKKHAHGKKKYKHVKSEKREKNKK